MNNRTQVSATSRTSPLRPAETGPTPAGATPGEVQILRAQPAGEGEWVATPARPQRLRRPGRPLDAWRDALLNTLIPVVGVLAIAIAVFLVVQIQLS